MRGFNLLIFLTLIFLSVIAITNFQQIYVLQKTVIEQSADVNILQNKIDNILTAELRKPKVTATEESVEVTGIIKKEPVPQELALGDYWYWLYFDQPYLLINNASGSPQFIDKIQIIPAPERTNEMFDAYVNSHVEAFAVPTWGYAESNVFRIIALTKL